MSHIYTYNSTVFECNSDLSGEVTITNTDTNIEMEVRGDDLIKFVADYVRRCKINDLENATEMEILLTKIW